MGIREIWFEGSRCPGTRQATPNLRLEGLEQHLDTFTAKEAAEALVELRQSSVETAELF